MPNCDETGCYHEARAACTHCGLILCPNHGGRAGSKCPECNYPMEGLSE